jgi:hypothetical protein
MATKAATLQTFKISLTVILGPMIKAPFSPFT